jgi:hypothetical protein
MIFLLQGGCGGGILRLNGRTKVKIDGTLGANGDDGETLAGGGAGGSIYITTEEFDGLGTIEVSSNPLKNEFILS